LDKGLLDLDLPDDVRVVVEAYRQTSYERAECGTIGKLESAKVAELSRVSSADGLRLRVKVVGTGESDYGRILAVADRLRPESAKVGTDPSPLLPFKADPNLGNYILRSPHEG
jgi:hypothetical protein